MSRSPRTLVSALLGLAAAGVATSGQAACYTVYRQAAVVYRSIVVPVDLSKPLHATVPPAFGPGTTMVIAENVDGCRTIDNRRAATPAEATARAGARERRRRAETDRWFDRRARPIESQVGVSPSSGERGDRGEGARSDAAPMRPDAYRPVGTMR